MYLLHNDANWKTVKSERNGSYENIAKREKEATEEWCNLFFDSAEK